MEERRDSNSKQHLISPEEKPKPEATREPSCFGDSSVGIAVAAAGDSGHGGTLDRKLQAATTAVYSASLHSGKELLIRVTWTRNAAGATGLAVAFDDALSPSSRCAHHVLHKKRGSRSLATAAGTAVGVHWDTAEATYASGSSPEPTGDYYLAVVADAELALLLGEGGAARDLSRRFGDDGGGAVVLSRREQLRGAATAHTTRCRFREGGAEHEVAVHATRGGGGGGEGEVRVSIDGKRVAEVRRVGWGFRGNRAAVLADGEVVDVMWDVHDWWFGRGGGGGGAGAGAQFMVRARAEKEGRLWMADQPPARGGFFLHVQCYRR
ncbi:hypothetical protein OsJ_28257 [Oryza sativa Japonica Group]|uniref:Uncharacterized protein n=1 Tax=Oryza sativa subsp. japonica TaxID=39947 RepID=B9FYI4_ORYSJ|nr:hypothetical protein OsJ_28257 [Oryza sativa Japonica Group]